MQRFLLPQAPASAVICFLSEPNIPEGPEHEKYQHYIDTWGEILPAPHRNNDN